MVHSGSIELVGMTDIDIILSSDGIDTLGDTQEIAGAYWRNQNEDLRATELSSALVEAVLKVDKPTQDNVSILVCRRTLRSDDSRSQSQTGRTDQTTARKGQRSPRLAIVYVLPPLVAALLVSLFINWLMYQRISDNSAMGVDAEARLEILETRIDSTTGDVLSELEDLRRQVANADEPPIFPLGPAASKLLSEIEALRQEVLRLEQEVLRLEDLIEYPPGHSTSDQRQD